jgi:hypothetical protein
MLAITFPFVPAGFVTLSVEFSFTPFSEAATVAEPTATPVASPFELIVATAAVATVQLAVELTSAVELSL